MFTRIIVGNNITRGCNLLHVLKGTVKSFLKDLWKEGVRPDDGITGQSGKKQV